MKIFKTVSMSTWDIGIIKLAVALMGIAIGSTWPNIFAPYAGLMFSVGILFGIYMFYIWLKK